MIPTLPKSTDRGLSAALGRCRLWGKTSPSFPVLTVAAVILIFGIARQGDMASHLTLWMTSALLALSLQFIWGNVGILSFAQAVFFGVGAYVYGVLSINFGVQGSTLVWGIPAGIVAATLAAGLGYFIFYGKLNDIAVAIITYAFTLIFAALASGFSFQIGSASIGGANGLVGIMPMAFGFGDNYVVASPLTGFIVTLFCATVIWLILTRLRHARYGRVLNGIRQNEDRSSLIGYDIRLFKVSSFALAGGVAGIAGSLFAAWSQFVNPGQFSAQSATLVVIWVLVGGRRSPVGSVVGAILISAVQFYFGSSDISQYVALILGVLVVLIILVAPDGVAALTRKAWRSVFNRNSGALDRQVTTAPVDRADHVEPKPVAVAPLGDHGRSENSLLTVRGVSKSYGGVKAVRSVDFTLDRNEIKCIIGPNGAGKSSLFGLLSGRIRLDEGSIVFDGHDISSLPSFKRARLGLGIKLQTASFFPELTVRENISLAARGEPERARAALVENCIVEAGLTEVRDVEAYSLSHGQQQWLEIGMVLAQKPTLILLDEPVAGMTIGERTQTVNMIHRLSQKCGVVVVEHDMGVVEELGGDVIVMHEGQILRTGHISDLRHDDAVMDAYLGREAAEHGATATKPNLEL